METDKEGKWQRDDYDGPGESGEEPAANANAYVVVVSCKKEERVVFFFVSSGTFFLLV